MIGYNLIFYLRIISAIVFLILAIICFMLTIKAKREYKSAFLVTAIGSIFCIVYQLIFIANLPVSSNTINTLAAASLIPISLATLFFMKKFNN
jgi:uncharacterized membrane protein HdeD (DUF308 family)